MGILLGKGIAGIAQGGQHVQRLFYVPVLGNLQGKPQGGQRGHLVEKLYPKPVLEGQGNFREGSPPENEPIGLPARQFFPINSLLAKGFGSQLVSQLLVGSK